jgi:ATP-dependent DNA helicase RecG
VPLFQNPNSTNSANYDTVNGRVNDIVNDAINENEQAIINLLIVTPGLNASEIANHIGKSVRTTMRYIKSLQEKGRIWTKRKMKTSF